MGIQVPPESTGKIVETNSPDGTTQRQVVTVGDAATAANTLKITDSNEARVEATGTLKIQQQREVVAQLLIVKATLQSQAGFVPFEVPEFLGGF